jgi:hypothetical protein
LYFSSASQIRALQCFASGHLSAHESALLRIESNSDGQTKVIRLIGRSQSEHVDQLKKQLDENPLVRTVLDLKEITLVNIDVVRFLGASEDKGVELRHCSPYVRDWIDRERDEAKRI